MANKGIADIATEMSVPDLDDLQELCDDPSGTPAGTKVKLRRILALIGFEPGGRLTLTSGLPVTTGDVTAAGTLYYAPYKHNRIRVYDGTRWQVYTFAELSLALTLTSGKPYDIFVYDNAGTLTLEALVWTNDTTRATALTKQDGVYVKTGATTRLYLGTIYSSGSNTTEDSAAKRFVWNMFNRIRRTLQVLEATDSWNYSTATIRQANGSTANQLDYIVGLNEDGVDAVAQVAVTTSTSTPRSMTVGVGVDSTTVISGLMARGTTISGNTLTMTASYRGTPGVGRHYLAWLEYGAGTDTQTWYGDAGAPTLIQSGINGNVFG